MEVKQKASFLIGLIFVILGLLAKSFYRDYIISQGIDDFGLADVLPGFLYVIGFSQLLMISSLRYPAIVIMVVSLGSVIFEFKQYYRSGTLDVGDIIASVAGGLVSWFILIYVAKKFKNQENTES